eukprot:1094845-Pyramimonas_sp.AAC.1
MQEECPFVVVMWRLNARPQQDDAQPTRRSGVKYIVEAQSFHNKTILEGYALARLTYGSKGDDAM